LAKWEVKSNQPPLSTEYDFLSTILTPHKGYKYFEGVSNILVSKKDIYVL